MTPRPDVAELLHAGYGDRTIARRLGVTIISVTRARIDLELPPANRGHKPAVSVEDLFWRRATPVAGDGGHMTWGGYLPKGNPAICWGDSQHSALRIAYRIANGAEPIGLAHRTCTYNGCVAPAHIADTAARKRHGHSRPNATREQVLELLHKGMGNQAIGKQLHTDPKRVAVIRREEHIPRTQTPARVLTFAEKWAAATQDTGDGHTVWTGRLRDGVTPSMVHRGRDYSARRAGFEELHGRDAVGFVFPGCRRDDCVRPEHLEDRPMREQLNAQFAAIFKEAA